MGSTRPPRPTLDPERARIRARLARAHGHLHGVMDMIDSGRSYPEVLQQIAAVRAALEKATALAIRDMIDGVEARPGGPKEFDELRAAIGTLT